MPRRGHSLCSHRLHAASPVRSRYSDRECRKRARSAIHDATRPLDRDGGRPDGLHGAQSAAGRIQCRAVQCAEHPAAAWRPARAAGLHLAKCVQAEPIRHHHGDHRRHPHRVAGADRGQLHRGDERHAAGRVHRAVARRTQRADRDHRRAAPAVVRHFRCRGRTRARSGPASGSCHEAERARSGRAAMATCRRSPDCACNPGRRYPEDWTGESDEEGCATGRAAPRASDPARSPSARYPKRRPSHWRRP